MMKLVVVSQNGCNPCTMVKNFLANEDVDFEVVNLSETPEKQEDFGVMSTPVTILFDEDEEVSRVAGFKPDELEVLVSQL